MSVLISGELLDGSGRPMPHCHIIIKSKINTHSVLQKTSFDILTNEAGEYSFNIETGKYSVYLKQDWCDVREYGVGDIAVYDDSCPGTLNDFLTALDEGELKPDVVKRFEEMVAQAQQSAEAAAESEQQVGQHAEAASLIKEQVETLADNVQQNAETVAASKQRVEQLASQVEGTAEEVRQDAEAAKKAASDAEQARDDIDVALSATLKTANHLSEIAAEGGYAQQESRNNLGLKSAAVRDAQAEIYDRTKDRLAIPGAFGYGHLFSSSEVVYFSAQNGPAEFLKWVFEVTPGRYAVTQYGGSGSSYKPIIAYDGGQPYFRGLVDIEIRSGMHTNSTESDGRCITFHGDAEYTGQAGEGPAKYQVLVSKSMSPARLPEAWSRLFWSRDRLRQLLCAGDTTSQRAPQPGSLVLAAYLPDSGSSDVTLLRTQVVQGSRLRQVVFEAEYRTTGFSAAARSFVYGNTLPGTYFALSGGPDVTFYDRGLVSLFVRAT
ncbi:MULTISPECIES: prophage tail fiber N-terminal domain-containing protein [Escherichia]|uniref:prophage tail fiber N-terminal domain-containing protein n=1 Tax=Escherichia TaxID=561 RepID=UPI0003EE8BD8|nr:MULTISPECIES: prophage tail fiber N-terminal domain-containing protein [Escherichia]